MKFVCLLLLGALAASVAACQRHPYSDVEKMEHKGEFAREPEGHAAAETPAPPR